MQLGEIITLACNSAAARLRRYVFAYALCTILAIVAIFEMTAAAVLVLEPHLGSVMSRLAIAAVLALGIVGIIVALRLVRRARRREAPAQTLPMATLLETFLLGYSVAQRLSERKSHKS